MQKRINLTIKKERFMISSQSVSQSVSQFGRFGTGNPKHGHDAGKEKVDYVKDVVMPLLEPGQYSAQKVAETAQASTADQPFDTKITAENVRQAAQRSDDVSLDTSTNRVKIIKG
jgi:hypothetical protein